VKPDLNLVYVVPPFMVPTGADFGWFCREHALHIYLLARLCGLNGQICIGDVTVDGDSDSQFLSTIGTGSDHAWCQVESVIPVDVSLSLRHFDGFDDPGLVFGCNEVPSGAYRILHHNSLYERRPSTRSRRLPYILYSCHKTLRHEPCDLIRRPYRFLLSPPPGQRSFADAYGEEIFDMITLHCLRLFRGETEPWSGQCDAGGAVQQAILKGLGARNILLGELSVLSQEQRPYHSD